jgi:aryl-phospho-beta-D-glucosidase BglC (GH1 family)
MRIRIFLFLILFCISQIRIEAQSLQNQGKIDDIHEFCSQQKGFNLLGKFDVSWSNYGFTEKEFKTIRDLGFNFVRLPLDYRTFTQPGNWDNFVEFEFLKIDKAIEWGKKYGVHVSINFHRTPGFCVNSTSNLPINQQLNLWTDIVAQNAFIKHWEYFALRYKNELPIDVSFNLVNEPTNVSEPAYTILMKRAVETIHAISPDRLIFIDGLDYGRKLLLSFKDEPNIAQAIHCYDPFMLTHYQASWVNGSMDWPVPHWPMLWVSTYLYGPWKSEFKSPLVLQGNFDTGTEVIVNVRQVSSESTLRVKAGNKVIFSKKFLCGPDLGDDFTKIVSNQWGYQNISNKDYKVSLTEPASSLTFENITGDWMTINYITLKTGEITQSYYLSDDTWGKKQSTYIVDENKKLKALTGEDLLPFQTYRNNIAFAKEHNIPIMVQEFGVHNRTPHQVSVAFLDDLVGFFKQHKIGWALWNLTGSFGILNSDRKDCTYENYEGYKLDRAMLEALSRTETTQTPVLHQFRNLNIYPTSVKNTLYANIQPFIGSCTFEIYSLTGRLEKTFSYEVNQPGIVKLDVSSLKPNLYILKTHGNGQMLTEKFIKQ